MLGEGGEQQVLMHCGHMAADLLDGGSLHASLPNPDAFPFEIIASRYSILGLGWKATSNPRGNGNGNGGEERSNNAIASVRYPSFLP